MEKSTEEKKNGLGLKVIRPVLAVGVLAIGAFTVNTKNSAIEEEISRYLKKDMPQTSSYESVICSGFTNTSCTINKIVDDKLKIEKIVLTNLEDGKDIFDKNFEDGKQLSTKIEIKGIEATEKGLIKNLLRNNRSLNRNQRESLSKRLEEKFDTKSDITLKLNMVNNNNNYSISTNIISNNSIMDSSIKLKGEVKDLITIIDSERFNPSMLEKMNLQEVDFNVSINKDIFNESIYLFYNEAIKDRNGNIKRINKEVKVDSDKKLTMNELTEAIRDNVIRKNIDKSDKILKDFETIVDKEAIKGKIIRIFDEDFTVNLKAENKNNKNILQLGDSLQKFLMYKNIDDLEKELNISIK